MTKVFISYFSTFLLAFGTSTVSSSKLERRQTNVVTDRRYQIENDTILMDWTLFYFDYPEYAEELEREIKYQIRSHGEITKERFLTLQHVWYPEGTRRVEVENFLKNYDTRKIEYIFEESKKVRNSFKKDEICTVLWRYDHVINFYSTFSQETHRDLKFLEELTEDEKIYIETLIEYYNRWFHNITDYQTFVNCAKSQENTEIYHRVYGKIFKVDDKLYREYFDDLKGYGDFSRRILKSL